MKGKFNILCLPGRTQWERDTEREPPPEAHTHARILAALTLNVEMRVKKDEKCIPGALALKLK
jgi:hypothetical protein